jgi:catechol 2,3-dioxygenase-like lactoylglutathione lyase family enzyme
VDIASVASGAARAHSKFLPAKLGVQGGASPLIDSHVAFSEAEMEPRITLITLGVSDLPRAVRFYRDGLGWPTTYKEGGPVAFFNTKGTRLALYPMGHLAADIAPDVPTYRSGFSGITLAHNVRSKDEADAVLKLAERAGGRIVKPAQDAFWGGYSGYFIDPDGHYWEVAWNPILPLDDAGFMDLKLDADSSVAADPMTKVDNILRRFVAVAIAAGAVALLAKGASEISGSIQNVGIKILVLILLLLVAGVVLIPAYWFWHKRDRELVTLGAVLASLALFFLLMSLPGRIGLDEWFFRRTQNPSTNPFVDVVTGVALFYVSLIFPYQVARWFYRKINSFATRWLTSSRPRNLTIGS